MPRTAPVPRRREDGGGPSAVCPFQTRGYLVHIRAADLLGFQAPSAEGFKWDSVRPSTAASPLPINHAIGRSVICVPLPSVAALRLSASTRRKPPVPRVTVSSARK